MTIRTLQLILLGTTILAYSAIAQAFRHTWDINELYSNADGTIQFVELFEAFGVTGQNDFSTARLRSLNSGGTMENIFNPVTDLPSTLTSNEFALFATSGFAMLTGAPTPDYILPDNFLFLAGGTASWTNVSGSISIDSIVYGALLTDGVTSLNRNGGSLIEAINSPTNFSGDSGSINAVPLPASVWLFGSGLLGLIGIARRK